MNKTRGLWRGKTTPKRNGYAFNNIWVSGDLIRSEGLCYIHPLANSIKVNGEIGKLVVMHEVDPSTLGACTGLRDKNGKLIFEGDVVKHKADVFEIKYSDEQARFLAVLANGVFNPVAIKNCEVIGNIYDNPELLKDTGEEKG